MAVPEPPGSRQSGQVLGLDDAKFISQEVANRLYDGTIEFLRRQAPASISRAGVVSVQCEPVFELPHDARFTPPFGAIQPRRLIGIS